MASARACHSRGGGRKGVPVRSSRYARTEAPGGRKQPGNAAGPESSAETAAGPRTGELLPFGGTAVSAVRGRFPAARLDCGVTLEGDDLTLTKEAKQEIVGKHGRSKDDTGSAHVQVALLTARVNELTEHLRAHPKDHYSRRGLLKLVGRRRRLLQYLQKRDLEGYRALIQELGLRR